MSTLIQASSLSSLVSTRPHGTLAMVQTWLRQRRERAQTRRSLAELGAAGLRDLGIAPCEIDSVVSELHGRAEAQRRRTLRAWPL